MGAWDVDAFGNDTAGDWAYDLDEQNDFTLVEQTLEKVTMAGTDYLDSDIACEALAAAEVVARAQGNFGFTNSYTEGVDAWVKKLAIKPSPDLCKKALNAIDRILAESSELLELWQESEEFEEWKNSVLELRNRIQA